MRILVLLAIALLLYVIISRLIRNARTPVERQQDNTEKMVKCDLCGLHVAEREAVHDNGHYFCCPDHLELSQRKK